MGLRVQDVGTLGAEGFRYPGFSDVDFVQGGFGGEELLVLQTNGPEWGLATFYSQSPLLRGFQKAFRTSGRI